MFQSLNQNLASSPYLYLAVIIVLSATLSYLWLVHLPKKDKENSKEALKHRSVVDYSNTRNLLLKRHMDDFINLKLENRKEFDRSYYYLLGYIAACEDHFDIDSIEREKFEGTASFFYKLKYRVSLYLFSQLLVLVVIVLSLIRLVFLLFLTWTI